MKLLATRRRMGVSADTPGTAPGLSAHARMHVLSTSPVDGGCFGVLHVPPLHSQRINTCR